MIPSAVLVLNHAGPADHWATLITQATPEMKFEIYASGTALKKLEARSIKVHHPFVLDNTSPAEQVTFAEEIAKAHTTAHLVITDVSHPFAVEIHEKFKRYSTARLVSYYDNPENYVPGGYSEVAEKVIKASQEIWFANANLAKAEPFSKLDQTKRGIGYYPVEQAKALAKRRAEEGTAMRKEFFARFSPTQPTQFHDRGQQIWVYFGGNNETYFSTALPQLFALLEKAMEEKIDLSHLILLFQMHPGSKDKKIEEVKIREWKEKYQAEGLAPKIEILTPYLGEGSILADVAFYHQSSASAGWALAGIPCLQIGPRFDDLLVRNNLTPSINELAKLKQFINERPSVPQEETILHELGFRPDWPANLDKALKHESL